jgi:hypothetical protein
VDAGQYLTLTATGVADPFDPAGRVVSVLYYRESNHEPGLQTDGDSLVGTDNYPDDGCSVSVSTVGLVGTDTYYALAVDNEGGKSNEGLAAAATTNTVRATCNMDVDCNGQADALTDGILILRYLFDPAGAWNYSDALGSGAARTTRTGIRLFLDGGRTTGLDVDGNGTPDALTDGILILRYLFDPAGAWNYSDALGSGAVRTTRAAIKAYLDLYNPAAAAPSSSHIAVFAPQAAADPASTCNRDDPAAFEDAFHDSPIIVDARSDQPMPSVVPSPLLGRSDGDFPVDRTATCAQSSKPEILRAKDTVFQAWRPSRGDSLPVRGLARVHSAHPPIDCQPSDELEGDGDLGWLSWKSLRKQASRACRPWTPAS